MSGRHCENYDVKRETVQLTAVARDLRWLDVVAGISARFSNFDFVLFFYINGRKDSRVTITLNKETTVCNLENVFRHSHVIFICK